MDETEERRLYLKARKRQKALATEIDQTYRDLLSLPRGRVFLWHLLELGKVGTQPYTNNALSTAFGCGELNVGNQILARILEVDPAGYVRMIQEQADAEREYRNARDADSAGDTDEPA